IGALRPHVLRYNRGSSIARRASAAAREADGVRWPGPAPGAAQALRERAATGNCADISET
ncbi:MAG: hypothetical protein NFW04_16425, partial [Candidatus Accumulibacter sp.]|uniref:hypothetical protein n=1 Tax=Accumulibacter sp. TaxID=2053492 RepID=UPI0025FAA301